MLEGSVRRWGHQLLVTAQLIDAETDAHLWAERFDRDTEDLFALQDEIVSRLANALGVELIAAEASRPAEHPDALDPIHRGRIVKNTGDGFLAEFASVVDAVRCAVEVQRGMAERMPLSRR